MSGYNFGYYDEVRKFKAISLSNVNKFTRSVAQAVYRSVVDKTPIDTGRAKASWNLRVGDNADKSTATLQVDIPKIRAHRAQNEMKAKTIGESDTYILSNNLHYIRKLDSGTGSKQAPFGMVSITIEEIAARVRARVI